MKTTQLILLLTLLLTISPQLVKSQFFVELNTGYAAPVYLGYLKNNETNFPNNFRYYDNSKGIDTSYTTYNKVNMGSGVLFGSKFGYKFKKNWLVSVNCAYLNNYKVNLFYTPFSTETLRQSNSYYENGEYILYNYHKQTFYSGARLSLIPSITYRGLLNDKFGFESSLGFSLSYLCLYRDIEVSTKSIFGYGNIKNSDLNKTVYKEYYKKDNYCGAFLSVSFIYLISNNFELNINAELNCSSGFSVKRGEQYYQLEYREVNDKVFLNNEDLSKLDLPSTLPEYYNFNTVNFSLGIRYYFNDKTISNKN